jgi:acetoin utilization protein AcuC
VRATCGRSAPSWMGEDRPVGFARWEDGYDPASWLDRAINATRTEIFPLHGLDPLP